MGAFGLLSVVKPRPTNVWTGSMAGPGDRRRGPYAAEGKNGKSVTTFTFGALRRTLTYPAASIALMPLFMVCGEHPSFLALGAGGSLKESWPVSAARFSYKSQE